MSKYWRSTNREMMSFKLNPIFLCGMCIFPIFIGGIPLNDVIKRAPDVNAADLSSVDQISETPINLDDFSVDAQQQSIFDEQSSVLDHGYNSRDLHQLEGDAEDYTATPVYGFDFKKSAPNKPHKSDREVEFAALGLNSIESTIRKPKRKTQGGAKSFSFVSINDLGTSLFPISKERFGNKIFLFKKDNDIDSAPRAFSKKDDDGKNSLFLFNDGLPDPSENIKSKKSFLF